MISSRLRALTAIVGLDLIGNEPDLRGHAATDRALRPRRRHLLPRRRARRSGRRGQRRLDRSAHQDRLQGPHPRRARRLEACVFQALRERLRCKESGFGAHEWRNPEEDLPADFEIHGAEHYDQLHKPLDPKAFTAGLREEMRTELAALNDALPHLDWLRITERKSGAIQLTAVSSREALQRWVLGAPAARRLRLRYEHRHQRRRRRRPQDAGLRSQVRLRRPLPQVAAQRTADGADQAPPASPRSRNAIRPTAVALL